MKDAFVEDRVYTKSDFNKAALANEFENCSFDSCNFSNVNLDEVKFIDCSFIGCDLSLAKLHHTVFRDVNFYGCKMIGLLFSECSNFGLSFKFENCILNNSSFYKTKIKATLFKDSQLTEVDFTDCDLTETILQNCNLTGATFENTNLEKADLRGSYNFSIDADNNKIKKAKFSLSQLPGLLDKYKIEIDRNS